MACYVLTINNSGKLREGSNEVVDWVFPHFQVIKDTSFSFTINKCFKAVLGRVAGLKGWGGRNVNSQWLCRKYGYESNS